MVLKIPMVTLCSYFFYLYHTALYFLFLFLSCYIFPEICLFYLMIQTIKEIYPLKNCNLTEKLQKVLFNTSGWHVPLRKFLYAKSRNSLKSSPSFLTPALDSMDASRIHYLTGPQLQGTYMVSKF